VVREKVLPGTVVIKLYFVSWNLALKVLLVLHNAPGHLQDLRLTYLNSEVDHLSNTTTSLLQQPITTVSWMQDRRPLLESVNATNHNITDSALN
jgi:hypothetical protein